MSLRVCREITRSFRVSGMLYASAVGGSSWSTHMVACVTAISCWPREPAIRPWRCSASPVSPHTSSSVPCSVATRTFIEADRIRDPSGCVLRYERTFMRPLLPGHPSGRCNWRQPDPGGAGEGGPCSGAAVGEVGGAAHGCRVGVVFQAGPLLEGTGDDVRETAEGPISPSVAAASASSTW